MEENQPSFSPLLVNNCDLESLSLNDICLLSQTCVKARDLCGDHVEKKYKGKLEKKVTIDCEMGRFKIWPNDVFTQSFIDRMQSVEIYRLNIENVAAFANRIQKLERLTSIRFSFCLFGMAFGHRIKDQLVNVENVDFNSCKGEMDFYNDILMQCTRLKRLRIDSPNWKNLSINAFAALEVFEYFVYEEAAVGVLNEVVAKNPTIKRLVCHFVTRVTFVSKEALYSLGEFLINIKHIDEIFLDFWGDCDFQRIANTLKLMDDRDVTKRIVFKYNSFNKGNFDRLASLSTLTELCLDSYGIDSESTKILSSFGLLKSLRLGRIDYGYSDICANRLSEEHPFLEELHLEGAKSWSKSWDRGIEVKQTILPFVRNSSKLRKLVLINTATIDDYNQIPTLNDKRMDLKDACPLTIFMERPADDLLMHSINMLNGRNGLVQIKPIEMVSNGASFDYPFRNYSLRELKNWE